ncbi:hypothetical protein ANTPLA_LOCUS3675 [Anthophora plagiata]
MIIFKYRKRNNIGEFKMCQSLDIATEARCSRGPGYSRARVFYKRDYLVPRKASSSIQAQQTWSGSRDSSRGTVSSVEQQRAKNHVRFSAVSLNNQHQLSKYTWSRDDDSTDSNRPLHTCILTYLEREREREIDREREEREVPKGLQGNCNSSTDVAAVCKAVYYTVSHAGD